MTIAAAPLACGSRFTASPIARVPRVAARRLSPGRRTVLNEPPLSDFGVIRTATIIRSMARSWRPALSAAVIYLTITLVFARPALTVEFSPLALFCRPSSGYVALEYSEYRDAPYVFFSGEPIRFDIGVYNTGAEALELVPDSPEPLGAFTFLVKPDSAPLVPRIAVAPTGYLAGIGAPRPVVFGQRVIVAPKQELMFEAQIATKELKPGRFRIELGTGMVDDRGRQIFRDASTLDFEFRDLSTPQAAADLTLRKGYRAYFAGRNAEAHRIADALLRKNRQSYGAMILKGHLIEKRNRVEALKFYRAAQAIVEKNADPWCSQCIDVGSGRGY